MAKLLVDTLEGTQQILEVGEGGGYIDPARVLWDERKDGPLVVDEANIGGYERVGSSLVFGASKKAQNDAKKQADDDVVKSEINKREARRSILKDIVAEKNPTVAKLHAALKALVEELGQ
jgi:hypothetical protein